MNKIIHPHFPTHPRPFPLRLPTDNTPAWWDIILR